MAKLKNSAVVQKYFCIEVDAKKLHFNFFEVFWQTHKVSWNKNLIDCRIWSLKWGSENKYIALCWKSKGCSFKLFCAFDGFWNPGFFFHVIGPGVTPGFNKDKWKTKTTGYACLDNRKRRAHLFDVFIVYFEYVITYLKNLHFWKITNYRGTGISETIQIWSQAYLCS